MQEKLNFTNEEELKAWLEKQPPEWSQIIAWRAAMRVTPVFGRLVATDLPKKLKQDLLFSVYRCLLMSLAARDCPTDDIKAAAYAAADARTSSAAAARIPFSASASAAAAAAAARAAADAADASAAAARAAAYAAVDAAYAAARATATAAAAMWRAVSADGDFLQNGGEPNTLALQPLWQGAPPEELAQLWQAHRQDAADFAPWQAWWEAAAGWDGQAPHDYFGAELSKRIALQPGEWWNRGASAVNADVVQWLNERGLDEGAPLFPPVKHRPHYAGDHIEKDENGVPIDYLGVKPEAEIFAQLLAAEKTPLPLAIGLFGPWGGGKSFFMESIQAEIKALAKEKAPGYHHAVAHITFNAWHYVDADLWASLGLRIFEGVTDHLGEGRENGAEDERLELGKKISSNQRIKTESESAIETAKKRREEAAEELEKQQEQQREQTDGDLLTAVKKAAGDQLSIDIKKIAEAVGIATPQQLKDIEATLQEAIRTKEKIEKNFPKWAVKRFPPEYLVALISALGLAFFAVSFAPGMKAFLGDLLSGLAASGSALVAVIAGWAAKVAPMLKKAQETATLAEGYKQRFDAAREAQRPAEPDAKKLAEIDGEIAALKSKIAAADKEIMAAEARLLAVDSGMLIYDHLTERVKDPRYIDRQGVVAVLHRDLKDLESYLQKQTREEGKIQRIILYIDDLDRCEPARVVEVLQAVHLLLAFPLFAVIVAVDPRWLERSLYDKYVPGHLAMTRKDLAKVNFTPRNYLEKIFQIPYRLKPMDESFAGLVDGQTKDLIEKSEAAAPDSSAIMKQPEQSSADLAGLGINLDDFAAEDAATPPQTGASFPQDSSAGAAATTTTTTATTPPPERKPPEPLRLTAKEVEALKAMGPLIPTPRALKRLINIYLLTRLQEPEAAAAPEVVMILLGVEMGFPVAGKNLLERIRATAAASTATLASLIQHNPAAPEAEQAESKRLFDVLQTSAPKVTVQDVHPWLEFAERFSFDPPVVNAAGSNQQAA